MTQDRTGQWWWYQPRGLGARERRCYVSHDKGKRLDVVHHMEQGKTTEIRESQLRNRAEASRPYTGPGPVQPPRHERPEAPIERSVREVAERVRPAKDRKRVGDSVGRRFHRWLRGVGRCQWCKRTDLPLDVDHYPTRRLGDDLFAQLLCGGPEGCHRHRHDHGHLPGTDPQGTVQWMVKTQRENMAGFIRAELEDAA